MEEGVDGLLHDKTRPSRIPPLGPEMAERVLALTLAEAVSNGFFNYFAVPTNSRAINHFITMSLGTGGARLGGEARSAG
jgi:hypothetical protein